MPRIKKNKTTEVPCEEQRHTFEASYRQPRWFRFEFTDGNLSVLLIESVFVCLSEITSCVLSFSSPAYFYSVLQPISACTEQFSNSFSSPPMDTEGDVALEHAWKAFCILFFNHLHLFFSSSSFSKSLD